MLSYRWPEALDRYPVTPAILAEKEGWSAARLPLYAEDTYSQAALDATFPLDEAEIDADTHNEEVPAD
jgi:hypothetical protein